MWFDYVVEAIFKIYNLTKEYDIINDETSPNVTLFGPYGNDVPKKGDYLRIGYFCEAISPDMSICDWAFGIPREEEINNPRYQRIQWQGLDPHRLEKNINADEVFAGKTKFCNFLYSNPVPYREAFFKQLSKYKKIDAPGRSMNNMPSIDQLYTGDKWEIKRQFLSPYKFTIAFESYSYPGYQTEKLYDAMQMNSVPIYCGDPYIDEIFNKHSFVHSEDYLHAEKPTVTGFLKKYGQYNFKDFRPATYNGLYYGVRRKLKTFAKREKMKLQTGKLDFSPLIDRIIELDKNPDLYIEMLKQPWLKENKVPPVNHIKNRWRQIFDSV